MAATSIERGEKLAVVTWWPRKSSSRMTNKYFSTLRTNMAAQMSQKTKRMCSMRLLWLLL
jgi:hypothetical protein